MKTPLRPVLFGLLAFVASTLSAAASDPTIVERGPHHRVLEWRTIVADTAGRVREMPHQYTELQAGLHYLQDGQWLETQEEFQIVNGQAVAQVGPHKVILAGNINAPGSVDLLTPDGKRFVSNPMGLSFYDPITGKNVLIAEVKDCVGELVAPNVVLYPDAFTDIKGALRYTYTKTGFEQDVILQESPGRPEDYGLTGATTRLEMYTEFHQAPTPIISTRSLADNLPDEDLDFGMMQIVPGRAFALGNQELPFPVGRDWGQLRDPNAPGGVRNFLTESVEFASVSSIIEQLPVAPQAAFKMKDRIAQGHWPKLTASRMASAQHPTPVTQKPSVRPLAKAQSTDWLRSPALVLDYATISTTNLNNYTFKSGQTYYITGTVTAGGTTTFEPGCVLKYAPASSARLTITSSINWLAQPYRPVVFTARDDQSVGEIVGTNTLSGYYADIALQISSTTTTTLNNFRIANAKLGLSFNGSASNVIGNAAFVTCGGGVAITNRTASIRNVLFHNVVTNILGATSTCSLQHVTVDTAGWLSANTAGITMSAANSLLVGITNSLSWLTSTQSVVILSSPSGVFQLVGAGHHYLPTSSTNRNAGTTNTNYVDAGLLNEIKTKTTEAPQLLAGPISTATTLTPQVRRDTDTPDLGFHYDPIDYAVNDCVVTNTTVTINTTNTTASIINSTTLAAYGSAAGLHLTGNASVCSEGTPIYPIRFTHYMTAQEQPYVWGGTPSPNGEVSIYPQTTGSIGLRFTQFDFIPIPTTTYPVYFYPPSWYFGNLVIKDCGFFLAQVLAYGDLGTQVPYLNLVNNLFENSTLDLVANVKVDASNNLFKNGYTAFDPSTTSTTWSVRDNIFDSCSVGGSDNGNPGMHDHNGYINTAAFYPQDRLYPTNASDIVLSSFTYLTATNGFVGRYYHGATNFYNLGSRAANLARLQDYTTTVNQVKETTSTLDIGFHYVAMSNGLPQDLNTNGIPDYLDNHPTTCYCEACQAPTVTLTTPTAGQLFTISSTNIVLTAVSSDADGYVTKVEFYNGSTKLGEVLDLPGATSWTNQLVWAAVTAGSYSLTAKAYDNEGRVTTSSAVSITVNAMPTVTWVSPAQNTTNNAPASFTLTVTATDPDGSIYAVNYYRGNGTTIGTGTRSGNNYTYNWTGVTNGDYAVYAKVTDNRYAAITSPIRLLHSKSANDFPTISILTPTNNSTSTPGTPITIVATANDANSVARVEFYAGTNYLGADATPASGTNFTVAVSGWGPGTYVLTAKAFDTLNYKNTSSPVTNKVSDWTIVNGNGYWDTGFSDSLVNGVNSVGRSLVLSTNGGMFLGMDSGDASRPFQVWGTNTCAWTQTAPTTNTGHAYVRAMGWRGSEFILAGGNPVVPDVSSDYHVAAWNGTNWYALGNPLSAPNSPACFVESLAVVKGDIFIGGGFTQAGVYPSADTNVQYVARLQTNTWTRVGDGLNGSVWTIVAIGDDLYVGGDFTAAGGNTNIQHVAKLQGTNWVALGSGVNGSVRAFAVSGTDLYVGGVFTAAGSLTNVNCIARWNGQTWSRIGGGVSDGTSDCGTNINCVGVYDTPTNCVDALVVRNNEVYAGGEFTKAWNGTNAVPANYVARAIWDPEQRTWTWSGLDSGVDLDGDVVVRVRALAIRESNVANGYELFVTGRFSEAGHQPNMNIARWIVDSQDCLFTNAPIVHIDRPAAFETCTSGQNYPLSATAVDAAGNSEGITSVTFYVDGAEVGQYVSYDVNNAPFYTNWAYYPTSGVHEVIAIAVDTNIPPNVRQSSPITFNATATGAFSANYDHYDLTMNQPPISLNVMNNDSAGAKAITWVGRYSTSGLGLSQTPLGSLAIARGGTSVVYRPYPNAWGTDVFSYQITNSSGTTAEGAVGINIRALTATISSPPDGYTTNVSNSVAIVGTGNCLPSGYSNLSLLLNGSQVLTTTSTNFSYTLNTNTVGFYTFVAVARDTNGLTNASAPVTVILTSGTPGSLPQARIDRLIGTTTNDCTSLVFTNYTLVTTNYPVVRDGLVNLYGVASDSDSSPVYFRVLLYRPDDPINPFANVTPGTVDSLGFHSSTNINGNLIGLLNLSVVPNGIYDLVLHVRGGFSQTNTQVRIALDTDLKLGRFTFSEQDLVIPVNGIPLTVIRTYDSFNPVVGDFGYNWTYALNDMDVVIDEDRAPAPVLVSSGQDTFDETDITADMRTGGGRNVTLTLPDGRRATFVFSPDIKTEAAYPRWLSPPGVTATLRAADTLVINYYPWLWWSAPGTSAHIPFEVYDVPAYVLTTLDGTAYTVAREPQGTQVPFYWVDNADGQFGTNSHIQIQPRPGKPQLTQITQRTGDKIIISDAGVSHLDYRGTNTHTILFERDTLRRITAIRDPIGSTGLPTVKYIYNDDTGNLIQVLRLVDRTAGSYVTNVYHYDHAKFPHYITSIDNAAGVPITRNEYDDYGRLTAVTDAMGNRTQFLHDTTNRTEVVVDRLSYSTTNYYDLRGNVTNIVNSLGQTNRFVFDTNNWLLQSVNPLGQTTSYAYDTNGFRIATTNALGQVTRFNFDNAGQLLSKTNALQSVIRFAYDAAGHRTNVVDALGRTTSIDHDAYGRPNSIINALGQQRATSGSDSRGDLQFVQQVGGLRMDFAHDSNGNTTNTNFRWVNPDNTNVTQVLTNSTELDAANRVTRVIEPGNLSRRTIYDTAGRVSQSIDRLGATNSYLYDPRGSLIQTTYPDGTVTRNVYDARAQLLYSDDRHVPGATANGSHTLYDALGRVYRSERVTSVLIDITQDAGGWKSTLTSTGATLSTNLTSFDAAGRVQYSTNALGGVTRYEYDAAGRQTAVIDPLSNRTDYVFDAAGQLRYVTNALGRVTEYQYDAKGRRIKTIFPDLSFTTNAYNEIGQLLFVKDQAGLETDFLYDSLGRMTNITLPSVFNLEGGTNANPKFGYLYDSYGNLLSLRDPKGRETKSTYDAFGQLITRKLPLLQTNYQFYNALGQVAWSADFKGQSNRFVYDSLGRLATNYFFAAGSGSPGQTNVFLYDSNGRLYRTIRPEGTTTYAYNVDGAVTSVTSPEGTISYGYDAVMGWLTNAYTAKTDVRYGYDALGRLKTVSVVKREGATLGTPEVTTNTYTALGSLQTVSFPNGTRTVYDYNVLNLLTNVVHYNSATQVLAQYQYTVASDGQRLAAVEIRKESGGNYSTNWLVWAYDGLRRLTNETCGSTLAALNFTNRYGYDLAGNRLARTNIVGTNSVVTTCTYNANDQLLLETTGANIVTNAYDANGSVTNRSSGAETNWFAYSLEGRLATAVARRVEGGSAIAQTNQYFYDAAGMRTRAVMAGALNQTSLYLNDAQNLTGFSQVLEELPSVGGTPRMTYTLGNRVVSQKQSGGSVSHLMADGHGSTRLLTDVNGFITDRYTYDAYGVALDFTSTLSLPTRTALLYAGEQLDVGMQQYYLRARCYNPAVGRFGVQDAVDGVPANPLSYHKYAYTQNNPVNGIDPSGNETLVSMVVTAAIGTIMQVEHNFEIAYQGWKAGKKATELVQSRESILDTAARDASPGVDTATIIVHGVTHKASGWSQTPDETTGSSFQEKLTLAFAHPRIPRVANERLNHDFYEFNWGGFSIAERGAIPIKSVHEMALVHLQMAQFLVWMNGYANMDIISHSWGTTLTYDLQQTSGIETRNWVTMGSPLKTSTPKPAANGGNWINLYDLNDPVVHLEMFPPFPSTPRMADSVARTYFTDGGPGLTDTHSHVTQGLNLSYDFRSNLHHAGWVHSDYWISPQAASDLRKLLQ